MSNNIIQINKHLDEFTKCYICLGKLLDATMCPNCQKLSCQKCIQKWIIERKSQCPHCRMSLKLNQIISVRFINELNSVIENLHLTKQKAKHEICPTHNITLLYFCITCNESLCSDCFMFEAKHKEHKIEKLENIYNSHCLLIKNESKELKNKCDKLNNYLKLLNEKIIFVRNYKTERLIELEEVFEKMKNKLESLMHEKLTKLINSKNMIIDKLKFLDNFKSMIESELSEAPKSELISKSENIIKDLKEIEKEDEMKNDVLNISLDLPSDIHPPYESGSFEIKDYKLMILQFQHQISNGNNNNNNNNEYGAVNSNEVLYSEDLKTNGLIWRLKVYPFGNGAIKGEFVSVFLELRDGLMESSKYFYKIEIENFYKDSGNALTQFSSVSNYIGKRTNFWKEFSSDFQNGECWGYNKFYRIEDLEKDGFIDETGKLTFRFYVRPQTYAQLCRDQKNYIKNLEKNNQNLNNQINKLNKINIVKDNVVNENLNNLKQESIKYLYNKFNQNEKPTDHKGENEDSNKMPISDPNTANYNSPELNARLENSSSLPNNNNNDNLIKIENEYSNNHEENLNSENNSPILTASQVINKMDIVSEEKIYENIDCISNTQIKLKKSQSIIATNKLINSNQDNNYNKNNYIHPPKEDLNIINSQNLIVLNKDNQNERINKQTNLNDEIMHEENLIMENQNSKKEHKISSINTFTVNCDNVDEVYFENNNKNGSINNDGYNNNNKFSILNHICENNIIKKNQVNQNNKQEEIDYNNKRDQIINFPLTPNNPNMDNLENKDYNSTKNENNTNTIINDKLNQNNIINLTNNNKIINQNDINNKSNQNKILNAISNLNNNINSNRYSKISNINTTNLKSNFASLNFNYKNNNNIISDSNSNDYNLNTNTETSTSNYMKGKLLKNSMSIANYNHNTLQNSNNSLENFNKQINHNKINNQTLDNNGRNNLISSNQIPKLNNLRSSVDNIDKISKRKETSNSSRNNNNSNKIISNNKHHNFPQMEISTEMIYDIKEEEPGFFLNYSEIKESKGLEDKQDQNANNLISQLKSENAEVENEPIIITEINYKDLTNKKNKNKLLKCEMLLNEIKVKDDSVKIIPNNNNEINYNNNNSNSMSKNKVNNPSLIRNINDNNKINLNNSNNVTNNNSNNNSHHKAKNSINILQEQPNNIEKELCFNPNEINERNSNMNKNLVLDISENLSQENNLNDSLGSLMESMKMIDDNSFYDQHVLNLQKIKRAKDIFEDGSNKDKFKAIKDFKIKNYKIEQSNREKISNDNFNLYPENQFFNNRHPSPFLSNHNNILTNSNNKRNSDKNHKEPYGSEIFNEKLKRLISKKKK